MTATTAPAAAAASSSWANANWVKTLKRLFARKIVLVSAIVLLLIALLAIFFPMLTDADPNDMNISLRLHAPSWAHWAGNDELGRDVMLRIIYGARYSLMIGFSPPWAPWCWAPSSACWPVTSAGSTHR